MASTAESPRDDIIAKDLPKPALDFLPRVRRLLEAKKQPDEHDVDGMKKRVVQALNELLAQSGLENHDTKSHDAILEVVAEEGVDFDVEKLFRKVVRNLGRIFTQIPKKESEMVVKSSIANRLVCSFAIGALKMSPQIGAI